MLLGTRIGPRKAQNGAGPLTYGSQTITNSSIYGALATLKRFDHIIFTGNLTQAATELFGTPFPRVSHDIGHAELREVTVAKRLYALIGGWELRIKSPISLQRSLAKVLLTGTKRLCLINHNFRILPPTRKRCSSPGTRTGLPTETRLL